MGTRIAVLSEIDDDLSTLSLPAEESDLTPSSQEDMRPGIDASESSKLPAEAPLSSNAEDIPITSLKYPTPSVSSGKSHKQRYPLYPSIAQLFHENGLSKSEADNIPASGPKGRLLKGDVLGYLGKISSTYSSEQSTRITKLGHLDLSSVKPAPPQPSQSPAQKEPRPELAPTFTEVAVPISLSTVISVQKRIQATLGVTLPLSTFISRATELANDDLPRSAATKPTADELFNDVLGLNNVNIKTLRGRYMPQITALPTEPFTQRLGTRGQPDVYDVLTGRSSVTTSSRNTRMSQPGTVADLGPEGSTNVLSISAVKGEEKRAKVFLERVKIMLQVEPGKLVL